MLRHARNIIRGKRETKENIVEANKAIASNLKIASGKTPEGPLGLRNCINTILYQEYKYTLIKRFRRKEFYKSVFFWLTMALLIGTVVGACIIIWSLANKSTPENPNTAAIISAIVGLVTTLLGLPSIIAKYLFNKDEDKTITDQLFSLQDSDRKEREAINDARSREKLGDIAEVLKAKPEPPEITKDTGKERKKHKRNTDQ
jgi:hypothetical protein